jgi:crotonobetainyl-CoA:carnitine CoA-transferase CaiB-like acyl-CoA transferase
LTFLEGIKVLDLTTSLAGPYATQLLADLGASVVKIERPPLGDDSRAWGPPFIDGDALWFIAVNRNKQSVVLDYGTEAGTQALRQLVQVADVVVVNQVESVQRKFGVDFETLREHRQGLIHASITGFGLTGSRKDLPCYDLIAEGYSGVMDLTGEAQGEPQKIGTPAGDLLAGQDAALAIVAALVRRNSTGQGCQIDVALVDSMTRFMAPRLVPYLGSGVLPRRSGARDSVIAIYQTFDTADEPLTLGLGNDRIWKRFWECVGDADYGRADGFASNTLRRQNRDEIVTRIQQILKTQPRAAWLEQFAAARVPAGPINRLDQVADDEELRARGLIYRVSSINGADLPQVGLGIKFDGESEACRISPPKLGQDTEQVLRAWTASRADPDVFARSAEAA